MPSVPDLPAGIASRSYFESQASQLAASATRAKPADSKLESYAHKFEAILIEKWLDDAESSFANSSPPVSADALRDLSISSSSPRNLDSSSETLDPAC